jgi:hypothetical protein
MGGMVTIFDPQGNKGEIPYERLADAVKAGAKPAVSVKSPDGQLGEIPANRVPDAVKAGATIIPLHEQENQHPGFWARAAEDLKGLLHPSGFSPYPGMDQEAKSQAAAQSGEQDQARKAAGYSVPYRALAPVAQSVGVNVPGMEQSAAEGDVGGVLGHAAAPIAAMAATEAIKQVGPVAKRTALLGKTPEEAYQSALKPSTTIAPEKVAKMVQTGLQEGIPVSKAGAEKLSSLIDDVNQKIADRIDAGKSTNIDTQAVAARADQVKAKFATQVNPTADLSAIESAKQEFLANNPNGISAAQAQAMKQGTYQQLSSKAYGELKSASIEAQKALARGLKEELATAFPELKDLNAKDSQLYSLQPILEKAVQREANHQLGGIGTPITAGATKAVTGSTGLSAVAGILKAVVDNPNIKSRLAIALSKQSGVTLPAANARIAAYSAALAASASNSETPAGRTDEQAK